MKKAGKERKPTPEDYNELISNVDIMLRAFRDLKSEAKSNWYWWRLDIYAGKSSFSEVCERVQKIWTDCKELAAKRAGLIDLAVHQESFLLDSCSMFERDGLSSPLDEFGFYFATSKDGTEAECSKIARTADSAVAELWFIDDFFADGVELSQYLDGFIHVRNARCSDNPRIAYVPKWWFEFVYSMAVKIDSIKNRCFEIHTIEDSPPIKGIQIWQNMRIMQNLPALDFRIHPEVRLIEHEICQASILALEFLRAEVKARVQPPPPKPAGIKGRRKKPVTKAIKIVLDEHPELEHQPTRLTDEVNEELALRGHEKTKVTVIKNALTRLRKKKK